MNKRSTKITKYMKGTELTHKQELFVQAFLETGGRDATLAARMAGYGGNHPQSVRNIANKLTHDPMILKRIADEAKNLMSANVVSAMCAMVEIANNPLHKDRLAAAKEVADRGGLMKIAHMRVDHIIKDERPTPELLAAVKEITSRLGVDATKLLGYDPGQVTDADFQEVDPEEPEDELSVLLRDVEAEEDDDD